MDYLVDSHCHLHEPWFNDLQPIIDRSRNANVNHIINCASDPRNYKQVIESSKFPEIDITLGIQPTLSNKYKNATVLQKIDNLKNKVVGIGEVGLDYYWVKEEKRRQDQKNLFIDCIRLANEINLPLIVHTRKAEDDSLDLLEKYAEVPVLLHSFDGNLKEINRAKDLGYLITIPTIVTRRKNRRKVAQRAGLDNIMIETDSPFCTTQDDIEKNEPKYILDAAKYLSSLLEEDFNQIQKVTTKNAMDFHKL